MMMNHTSKQCIMTLQQPAFVHRLFGVGVAAALLTASAIAAAAVEGDTYVYRVTNAYNNELRGHLSYRIDKTEGSRITQSVSADKPGLPTPTTEILTPEGKWLRHSIVNRERLVDYDFSPAYPAYEFPLEPGKEWSTRVNATNAETNTNHSVRVDAVVMGNERIRVPAGEFDTIKIKRQIYAGDGTFYQQLKETNIFETEWYAPAIGRAVRFERNSGYADLNRGVRNRVVRGDWDIFELVSAPAAR
jgi:hypothetical protein